jgi:hypothetical protein
MFKRVLWYGWSGFTSAWLVLELESRCSEGGGAGEDIECCWKKLLSFLNRTLVRFEDGRRCSTEVLWRTADSGVRNGHAVMVVVASSDAASFLSAVG